MVRRLLAVFGVCSLLATGVSLSPQQTAAQSASCQSFDAWVWAQSVFESNISQIAALDLEGDALGQGKIVDNLALHFQDRLKSHDAQSGEVLNRFERLLFALTRHQLFGVASFEGGGRQFVARRAPAPGVPTGRHYFKSQPIEHANQYR